MTAVNKHIEGSLIVLVEDNASLRRDIAFILQVAGFNILTAAGGEEALALLKRQTPDLVLSDVNMPGMSGFELLGHMRSEKKLNAIPCILTSANYSYDDLMRALDLGASEFLPKPFDAYELVDAVCVALEDKLPFKRAAG